MALTGSDVTPEVHNSSTQGGTCALNTSSFVVSADVNVDVNVDVVDDNVEVDAVAKVVGVDEFVDVVVVEVCVVVDCVVVVGCFVEKGGKVLEEVVLGRVSGSALIVHLRGRSEKR